MYGIVWNCVDLIVPRMEVHGSLMNSDTGFQTKMFLEKFLGFMKINLTMSEFVSKLSKDTMTFTRCFLANFRSFLSRVTRVKYMLLKLLLFTAVLLTAVIVISAVKHAQNYHFINVT